MRNTYKAVAALAATAALVAAAALPASAAPASGSAKKAVKAATSSRTAHSVPGAMKTPCGTVSAPLATTAAYATGKDDRWMWQADTSGNAEELYRQAIDSVLACDGWFSWTTDYDVDGLVEPTVMISDRNQDTLILVHRAGSTVSIVAAPDHAAPYYQSARMLIKAMKARGVTLHPAGMLVEHLKAGR